MKITSIQNEIVEEFDIFDSWMDKYEYLIELGKSVPVINPDNKIEGNIIKGCQSKVWVRAELVDNQIVFKADSDAIISKGIIAILIRVFSHHEPNEIIEANTDFVDKIGLKDHLSPNRANGLSSMIKQLKIYALAYQTKINNE